MRILRVVLLLIHAFVASRLTSGAAVDRYETERRQHTSVINLLDVRNERRVEEEDSAGGVRPTAAEEVDEEYYDYYYEEEDEEDLSGNYDEVEVPMVAMSSKPKDPSAILNAEREEGKRRRGKGKRKGRGKKRNPCLKKYKDFCIHGSCQYLRDLRAPSCVCHPNYSGHRCQFVTLPVGAGTRGPEGYNRTTALAVVAVVLSSLCLTIIGLLLALRFHKRGAYEVENEEKEKLGLSPNH